MSTLHILKDARALIADPAHWTREATARDGDGRICSPSSYRARTWSLAGALYDAADGELDAYRAAVEQLEQARPFPYTSIEEFNDLNDHPAVIALLDAEIARLGSGVQS